MDVSLTVPLKEQAKSPVKAMFRAMFGPFCVIVASRGLGT
jgi:hypothetical protein